MVVMMMALLVFSTGKLAPSIHDLSCREVPTSGVGHDATNLIRVWVKIPHARELREQEDGGLCSLGQKTTVHCTALHLKSQ